MVKPATLCCQIGKQARFLHFIGGCDHEKDFSGTPGSYCNVFSG